MNIQLLRGIVVKGFGALPEGAVVSVTKALAAELTQMGAAMIHAGDVLEEIAAEVEAEEAPPAPAKAKLGKGRK